MTRPMLIVILLAALTLPAQAVLVDLGGPGTATQVFQRNYGGAAISAGDVIASMPFAVLPTATGTPVPLGRIENKIDTPGVTNANSRLTFGVARLGTLEDQVEITPEGLTVLNNGKLKSGSLESTNATVTNATVGSLNVSGQSNMPGGLSTSYLHVDTGAEFMTDLTADGRPDAIRSPLLVTTQPLRP